jgi:hypothetical protein
VHSRNPTVDMHTYRFKLNETRIEICDVGGQKAERVRNILNFFGSWGAYYQDNSKKIFIKIFLFLPPLFPY